MYVKDHSRLVHFEKLHSRTMQVQRKFQRAESKYMLFRPKIFIINGPMTMTYLCILMTTVNSCVIWQRHYLPQGREHLQHKW